MIRTLIADDEAPARSELRYELANHADVEVVGEAETGRAALNLVREKKPDLLFLDIQMPELDGLEVVKRLLEGDRLPYVVFVTAYDRYALRAFELHALDYLLKPVESDRLRDCLGKVRNTATKDLLYRGALEKFAASLPQGAVHPNPEYIDQLAVRLGRRIYSVPVDGIHFLRVESGSVEVGTSEGRRLTNFSTLEDVEDSLNPKTFFRVHRSYIVNLRSIREIVPFPNQTFRLRVKDFDDVEIPLSRIQAKKLRKLLKF